MSDDLLKKEEERLLRTISRGGSAPKKPVVSKPETKQTPEQSEKQKQEEERHKQEWKRLQEQKEREMREKQEKAKLEKQKRIEQVKQELKENPVEKSQDREVISLTAEEDRIALEEKRLKKHLLSKNLDPEDEARKRKEEEEKRMLEQRYEEIRLKAQQRKANYDFYHSKDEDLEKQRMEELEKKKQEADAQRKAAAGEKISKLIDALS